LQCTQEGCAAASEGAFRVACVPYVLVATIRTLAMAGLSVHLVCDESVDPRAVGQSVAALEPASIDDRYAEVGAMERARGR
jgi:hypothetical protein